jgi:AcrR family transcriptional regulator
MTTAEVRPNQREHILDTALRLMSEHGSTGMSMRQLAAACDLQVAAIYHYFASKDALLAAVVAERQYGSRMADPLQVDLAAPLPERMRQLFHFVWEGALAEQAIWRLILGEGMRGERTVLPVGRDLLELLEPASRTWVDQVLPELEHPEAVARLLVGQLLAGFVRHVFQPEQDPFLIAEESAATLVEAVLG